MLKTDGPLSYIWLKARGQEFIQSFLLKFCVKTYLNKKANVFTLCLSMVSSTGKRNPVQRLVGFSFSFPTRSIPVTKIYRNQFLGLSCS